MKGRRVLAAAGVLAVTSWWSAAQGAEPLHLQVEIASYAYQPDGFTVRVGDTVVWTNKDEAPHTVTSASGPTQLDSPPLHKGSSWSFTASAPGTYHYYCAVHPDMTASFTVLAAAPVAPTAAARSTHVRALVSPAPAASKSSATPQSAIASSQGSAPGSTPPRTLDPTLLLVALTCGATATALLVLGRRVRPAS